MGAACMYNGSRTTASAYLEGAPPNLTILPHSPVAKILITGNKATGMGIIDGKEFKAKRDTILSSICISGRSFVPRYCAAFKTQNPQ